MKFYILVLIFVFPSAAMTKADVTAVCPSVFSPGNNIIECLVDAKAVSNARCVETVSSVLFVFKSKIGKVDQFCKAPYSTNSTNGNGSLGGVNAYQCAFEAKETVHTGGSITCMPSCGSVPPLNRNSTEGCQNITIRRESPSAECDNTCIGLAVGIPVVCACCILAGVTYYVLHRKPKTKPHPDPDQS